MRVLRLLVIPIGIAVGVVSLSVVACDDEGALGCRMDTDCPTGFICRSAICGLANPEAGAVDSGFYTVDAGGSCSSDGVLCTQSTECCSSTCADGRCASSPSTSLCKGLYQICQNDCCTGYTCTNGSCR